MRYFDFPHGLEDFVLDHFRGNVLVAFAGCFRNCFDLLHGLLTCFEVLNGDQHRHRLASSFNGDRIPMIVDFIIEDFAKPVSCLHCA